MLAPNPSQHLESETQPVGNPLQRFGLIESCSSCLVRSFAPSFAYAYAAALAFNA